MLTVKEHKGKDPRSMKTTTAQKLFFLEVSTKKCTGGIHPMSTKKWMS